MGSIPNQFPISLRAWPSAQETKSSALPSLISRINFERGNFRNISEESLREEIRLAEAGANGGEDNGSTQDEDGEEEPDRVKEVMEARDEILRQIEQAHMSSMVALDFISLLLSKDTPVQAGLSISQTLREAVGMGTLGADKLQTPRVTAAQRQENKRIAKGWKIQNLNKTVDSILASATRLEKEIQVETKYWEQVLAVSENGWAVCRLPQEKHTLGVRFGFSEAAPAFTNRSLAALRRSADGSITLDQGIGADSKPQRLRVRIETNGVQTGQVSLPQAVRQDAPIENLILQARNTIFAEELWQELSREARDLASYGVRSKGDFIECPVSATKSIILDLIPINEAVSPPLEGDNTIAEAVSLALHLLLSYAHRKIYSRRSKPPPPISKQKPPKPPYDLLRPIITRLAHQNAVASLHNLFTPLCALLGSTSTMPPASFTITPLPCQAQNYNKLSIAEQTLSSLIDRLETAASFAITPFIKITVTPRTSMYITGNPGQGGLAGTMFLMSVSGSALEEICPAPQNIWSFGEVKEFLLYATACALAIEFAADTKVKRNDSGENNEKEEAWVGDANAYLDENCEILETAIDRPGKEGWYRTIQGNVLRKSYKGMGKCKQLCFDIVESNGHFTVVLRWEWMTDAVNGERERRLTAGEGRYEWSGNGSINFGDGEGEMVRTLEEVVEEAGRWAEVSKKSTSLSI